MRRHIEVLEIQLETDDDNSRVFVFYLHFLGNDTLNEEPFNFLEKNQPM